MLTVQDSINAAVANAIGGMVATAVRNVDIDALVASAINEAMGIVAAPQSVPVIPAQDVHAEHKSAPSDPVVCEVCGTERPTTRGRRPKHWTCVKCEVEAMISAPKPQLKKSEGAANVPCDNPNCDGHHHISVSKKGKRYERHCHRCDGKGYMTADDIARNTGYVYNGTHFVPVA